MYGGSGTGKWDIYGSGADLRFSDNESAGSIRFDTSVGIGASPSNKLVVKDSGSTTIEINGQGRTNSLTLGVTASESKLFEAT